MEFNNKTIYILDSYGLIFRCYFAFINRPLTNSRGENISALFGFFRNLQYIFQHYQPGYLVAAMDSKTKTFRHEMYEQYKATRNKTPEDLHAQIPWICDILKALGVPVLQCDGYEADDIIATVAKRCEEQGRTCRILSGDKDLMQLVTESTQILKPESGAATWKVTGIEGVEAEWGVKPVQLLDLLALYGDTADNIPGVHGVGVKTASKLLNDYNDLDGIYAHIDEIKGAMQKKLIDGKENAYFSQKLVRLCETVPCDSIDELFKAEPIIYNFENAAKMLEGHEIPAVAKSYEQLELTLNAKNNARAKAKANNHYNLKEGETAETSSTPISSTVTTGTDLFAEPAFTQIKQNNTDSYKAITKIEELKAFIDQYNLDLNYKLKETVTDQDYADKNYTKLPLPIAFDCETDSLDTLNANLIGFSLCYEKGKSVYVPIQQPDQDMFSQTDYIELKDALKILVEFILKNPQSVIIMHNAKFDLKVLLSQCRKFPELKCDELHFIRACIVDTMVAAWLINPERTGKNGYSLESLAETQLGLKGIEFSDIVQKGQTFKDVPLETAYRYAAEDADFTFQLWEKFREKVNPELFKLEMQVLPALVQMELTGIHLDSDILHNFNKELTEGIEAAEKSIYKEVGHEFNIASPKQLQTVLFEERHLPTGKKTKTGYSTDTSVLEELAAIDPVPKMILEYREMAKLQSTYVETLPQLVDSQGRIHTDFVQTGTATGRLSCREPNLQNIPVRSDAGRRIRSAFTAPEGKVLISADYAQIELVVLAHLSGDKNMCQAFIDGTDDHKATAALIYGVSPEAVTPEMRRIAKTINFGVIYGMSAFSLAKDLGISRSQATNFIDMYFHTYSSVSNFMSNVISKAEETGCVETILGRRRPIPGITSSNKIEKAAAERVAKNTPIQGSAADIVKTAMINVIECFSQNNNPAKLLLQVHDELIFECDDNEETIQKAVSLIKKEMEGAIKLNVPLRVSIEYGKNWGKFH